MTRQPQPELHDGPELPLEALHVWDWFREIAANRTSNGFGPNPITFLDIRAWSELSGHAIRASEFRTIVMLDQLWREAWINASKAKSEFEAQKRRTEAGRR
jgi:hypothetical protein